MWTAVAVLPQAAERETEARAVQKQLQHALAWPLQRKTQAAELLQEPTPCKMQRSGPLSRKGSGKRGCLQSARVAAHGRPNGRYEAQEPLSNVNFVPSRILISHLARVE